MTTIEKNGNDWTIRIDHAPGDMNKFIAKTIKAAGLRVSDASVQVIHNADPGRTWIKKLGATSCVAYG